MECVHTDNGFDFTNCFFNRKRDLQTLFEKTAAELGVRHKLIHPLPHGATAKWSAATVRIRNVSILATPSTLWMTLQSSSPFTIPDPTTYLRDPSTGSLPLSSLSIMFDKLTRERVL